MSAPTEEIDRELSPQMEELRVAIVRMCKEYGPVTDHFYDLARELVSNIDAGDENDEYGDFDF